MTNAIVVKKAHYTRVRRAKAWAEERQAKIEKQRRRNVRQGWKAHQAAERNILPEQIHAFNPIRGLGKV